MLINVNAVRSKNIYFRVKTEKEEKHKHWGPAEDITYNIQLKPKNLFPLKKRTILMIKYNQPKGGCAPARVGGQRRWRSWLSEWTSLRQEQPSFRQRLDWRDEQGCSHQYVRA